MNIKKLASLVLTIFLSFSFVACNNNNSSGKIRMHVLWDQLTFVLGDDIHKAVAADEASIASGAFPDIKRAQSIVDNTKVMLEYTDANNIAIKATNMGWNVGLTQSLLQCFMVQDGPDIIQGEEQLPDFIRRGYIEPFPDDFAARVKEKVSPIAYKGLETNGKLYGLAINPGVTLLYWNKAILRQAFSADDPLYRIVDEGPKDWAEWETAMQRVDAINPGSAAPRAGGVYVGPNPGGYLRIGALLDSNGGYYADSTGAPSINTQANKETFEFLRRMAKYNTNGILNSSDYFTTYDRAFKAGEIAYMVDGSWSMYELDVLGMDFGVSLLPPKVAEGRPGTFTIGACYMAVPTYTQYKDHAFKIIEQMLDPRIQDGIAKLGYRLPVLKSTIVSDTFEQENPKGFEFANYVANNEVRGLPPFKGRVSGIWDQVNIVFADVYTFSGAPLSISSILSNAQAQMTSEYNRP